MKSSQCQVPCNDSGLEKRDRVESDAAFYRGPGMSIQIDSDYSGFGEDWNTEDNFKKGHVFRTVGFHHSRYIAWYGN
jgi:hypothetical protein